MRFTAATGLLAGIVALSIYAVYLSSGHFLSRATMSTLTPLLAVAVILSLGQALVIGTGGIDLSTPYVMTLVGSIMLYVSDEQTSRVGLAVLISLGACFVIGAISGTLVEVFGLNSLVATLAVGMLVAGITRLYRGPVDTVTSVPDDMQSWARTNVFGLSVLLAVAALLVTALSFVTRSSVRGRRLVASSAAPRTAYLVGLWSTSYRVLAYAMAAVLYGIGAITLAGLLGSPDLTFGNAFQLPPIVAVVIGGAVLTGGRISYVAVGLGAVFITLLDYVFRIAGYTSGVSMMAQGVVLAAGLASIHLIRQRSLSNARGSHADLQAPQPWVQPLTDR